MGQIKNIKLHIVTDIKTQLSSIIKKWLALYCVADFLTTPNRTAEESPRLLVVNLSTCTRRKQDPLPNVETVKKSFEESNLFDPKFWQPFREQRRPCLEHMEDPVVLNVFVQGSCE